MLAISIYKLFNIQCKAVEKTVKKKRTKNEPVYDAV